MSDIFDIYSQPREVTANAAAKWAEILNNLIKDLNTESVSTAEYEAKVRKQFEEGEPSDKLSNLVTEFTASLFEIIDSSAVDSTQAYGMLRNLLSDVKDERDYHVKHEARMTKPKASVGAEFSEKKDHANLIKDHIENLYNLSTMGMFTWDTDICPQVKQLKDGTLKPDLPRIPSGPREGGGRKAATANLRLVVNGTQYMTDSVAKVCHDVLSNGANRVSVNDLIVIVEKEGGKFSENWGPYEVNGLSVSGVIVSDAATLPDDEEEDDPDEEAIFGKEYPVD